MNHFEKHPQFEKELAQLSKKYHSLPEDLQRFERLIAENPVGVGTNFATIHHAHDVQIVKARLACKSLKNRSMRIIYAFHGGISTFVHIEIYFKGNKSNEDFERIREYLASVKK